MIRILVYDSKLRLALQETVESKEKASLIVKCYPRKDFDDWTFVAEENGGDVEILEGEEKEKFLHQSYLQLT